LHFYFDDPLGTRRAQANSSGQLEAAYQSLPFGDGLNQVPYVSGVTDPTENHFTGKERDIESGNDYMFARYYNSATGRFLSPDWSAKYEPVPYAKLDNPQSLNLYSYVLNNPVALADQDGHDGCTVEGITECTFALNDENSTKDPSAEEQQVDEMINAVGQVRKGAQAQAQQQMHYQHNRTQQATVPVTVSKVKANQPFGHSTIAIGSDHAVGLVPNSTAQAAAAVAVQGDVTANIGVVPHVSVPGHIEPSNESSEGSVTIFVTPEQANAMRSYIDEASSHPQRYDAAYHNCTEFSEGVLGAGGVKAPRDVTPGGLVNDLSK
jgi:RHS repeat-associated protein